jgi:phosphoglycolate phosphatase
MIPFVIIDFKKLLAESAYKTKLFPEVVEILSKLKSSGYRVGLLTSSPKKTIEIVLNKYGLSDFFEFLKTDASIYHKERDIQKVIRQNQLDKSNLYYVGDEIRDLHACRKLGIQCISVSWGFSSRELLQKENPEIILDKPSEILEFFEKNV